MNITQAIKDSAHTADYERSMDLETMVEVHGRKLLRYCCVLLRDYHEAQDVVQATFLKALSKKSHSELAPWLYRTAYNNSIDILRKRKWLRFFADEKDNAASCNMEDGMSENVREALSVLTPAERALVISRAIDDMDYEQMVLIYGASSAALRKRYERAKKKLANALREQGLEA